MCGITVLVKKGSNVNKKIKDLTRLLSRREPDDELLFS